MKFFRKLFGAREPDPPVPSGTVRISDMQVEYEAPNGRVDRIAWDDVKLAEIVTTDEGPFVDDVFFVISGSGAGTACIVPQGADGSTELLERLQKLPGFQSERVIEAMSCTDNKRFLLWEPGEQQPNRSNKSE